MERKKQEYIVSIIIPIYNVENYLNQCIDSIVNQTYQNLDIILVDDGSTDNSSAICDDYAKADSRVQVIHKANGGLISAWKTGVENSKGKYLVFIDSDDWLDTEMVEQLLAYADGSCKEMICSNYIIEKPKDKIPVKQKMTPGVYNREQIEAVLFPKLLGCEPRMIHASRCMKLISKELIIDNMQYCNPKVTMGEDLNITFPAILDTERIVVMEEGYFYHYRSLNSSMAHHYDPKLYKQIQLLYHAGEKVIETKFFTAQKEIWLEKWKKEYVILLLLVVKNELRGPRKGMFKRIRTLFNNVQIEHSFPSEPIQFAEMNSKLLYLILMNPNRMNVAIGYLIITIFDKIQEIRNH